jgi:hypothetical protein
VTGLANQDDFNIIRELSKHAYVLVVFIQHQYRLVQSGKTTSGGCSAGQGSSEPVAPRITSYNTVCMFIYVHFICNAVSRVAQAV